jgi:hypothetical protein
MARTPLKTKHALAKAEPPRPKAEPQPPETEDSKLERTKMIAQHLFTAIGYLEQSSDRTNAHGRAEDVLGYLQKMIDDRKRDA